MLNSLRQLLNRAPLSSEVGVFNAWAGSRQFSVRRVREVQGCVMDGLLAGHACRVEWGPSQRSYIDGLELRLIAELELPRDLVLLLLNRPLMALMETTVYEQFVDQVQTRIDTDTPAEMRWLVMFSRAGPNELGRLRERYGAATNLMPWLVQWLSTPLNDALAATLDMVPADRPVVLTIKSGRLLLRTAMPEPDAQALTQWVSVYEHALREAVRMGNAWRQAVGSGPQTQPYAWPLGEASSTPR
jgi:hypothetical protein